jgi:hypothetical protein
MAFADPQSITLGTVAKTLPRISSGANTSSYQDAEGSVKLTASHNYGKRTRRVIRVDHSKISPDSFSSANLRHTMSAYLVVDVPLDGYTVTEQAEVVNGLVDYLAANADAQVTKLLGGEN